jgi:hypothetical protein
MDFNSYACNILYKALHGIFYVPAMLECSIFPFLYFSVSSMRYGHQGDNIPKCMLMCFVECCSLLEPL